MKPINPHHTRVTIQDRGLDSLASPQGVCYAEYISDIVIGKGSCCQSVIFNAVFGESRVNQKGAIRLGGSAAISIRQWSFQFKEDKTVGVICFSKVFFRDLKEIG
eukprot:9471288-Pyramimonas_sp.AAC.2